MRPLFGAYKISDRETQAYIGIGFSEDECNKIAVDYINQNPNATVIITALMGRVWKCKTTGKIRTDKKEEL